MEYKKFDSTIIARIKAYALAILKKKIKGACL